MKKMESALRAIEDLATHTALERITFDHHKNTAEGDKEIDMIYRFAHVGLGCCNSGKHMNWEIELNEYIGSMEKSR